MVFLRFVARTGLLAGLSLALLTSCGGGGGNRRNVLLVVLDTVRADRVTWATGAPHDTTPFLAQLVANGAVFDRAVSSSSWTLPGFGSLLTGRIPSRHNAGLTVEFRGHDDVALAQLDSSAWTLPEVLATEGYHTAAFVNNPFLDAGLGLARGFDLYDYAHADNRDLRRADRLVDRVLDWFAHKPRGPWFAMVHFFDPHMDYDPPASVRGRFTSGYRGFLRAPIDQLEALRAGTLPLEPVDREFIRGLYDEEIHFVDVQLARLFADLEASGHLADTVVVITADHGEELFDHEGFEHGHSLYQEVIGVPLAVLGPGAVAARHGDPVGIVDVPATILAALDLAAPAAGEGVSLWPAVVGAAPLASRELVSEGVLYGDNQRSLLQWPMKLIETAANGRRQLFDLGSDPGELRDLASEQPETVEAMARSLAEIVHTATKERVQNNLATLPPEVRERLRSLGYID